jgi:hypothetical protein
MQLATSPRLNLAVDARARGEQRLRLAARVGDPRELEQLPQPDRLSRDRDRAWAHSGHLDEISTRRVHILTIPLCSGIYGGPMAGDILAIVLGILCFAVLYALMEGIDQI